MGGKVCERVWRCVKVCEGFWRCVKGLYSFALLPQMQIYCYQPHRFHSLDESIKAGGRITALAVLFEVCAHAYAPCCVIRECKCDDGGGWMGELPDSAEGVHACWSWISSLLLWTAFWPPAVGTFRQNRTDRILWGEATGTSAFRKSSPSWFHPPPAHLDDEEVPVASGWRPRYGADIAKIECLFRSVRCSPGLWLWWWSCQ